MGGLIHAVGSVHSRHVRRLACVEADVFAFGLDILFPTSVPSPFSPLPPRANPLFHSTTTPTAALSHFVLCTPDTLETYWDSRMDLLERRLKSHGEKLKVRANEQLAKIKTPTGEFQYPKDIEHEVKKFKVKVSARMASLTTAWQSAKVIRTREKVCHIAARCRSSDAHFVMPRSPFLSV